MSRHVRWGIIGAGEIAAQFAEGLSVVSGAELVAIGSRSEKSARSFSERFGVRKSFTSYDDLLADPEIDVVYVATPNHLHLEHSLMCLHAGKHLLCEKPFALNARQAREIADLAKQNNLFCMEAMWTRFIPTIRECFAKINAGEIGQPRLFVGDFGYPVPFDANSRLYSIEAGGGALLDLAVYPITLSYALFGPPSKIQSAVDMSESGVDQCSGLLFEYESGPIALIYSSFTTKTPTEARIMGDSGTIHINSPLYRPHRHNIQVFENVSLGDGSNARQNKNNLKNIIKRFPVVQKMALSIEKYASAILEAKRANVNAFVGNGYNYEIQEVCDCIRSGKTESDIMPLADSLGVLEIMDEVRAQWGLEFHAE